MLDDDQGRWLSYQELGEVLGSTPNAARMHAVRRKWPRRASNRIGELARVLVPKDLVVRPRAMHAVAQFDAQCIAPVPANGHAAFDARTDHERDRADQAERVARGEAAALRQQADALRAELDARRTWGLPRRLRWALWRR